MDREAYATVADAHWVKGFKAGVVLGILAGSLAGGVTAALFALWLRG